MLYPDTAISPPYHGDVETVKKMLSEGEKAHGCDIQRCVWGSCVHGGMIKSSFMAAPAGHEGVVATLAVLMDSYHAEHGSIAGSYDLVQGLMDACECGRDEIVQLMLRHPLFVDYNLNTTPTSTRKTFLGAAAYGLHASTIVCLLKAGADVDCLSPLSRSPFALACMAVYSSNKIAVLQLLLHHGADIGCVDYQGKGGLQHLERQKDHEALRFLQDHCQALTTTIRELLDRVLDPDSLQIMLEYFMP